MEKNYLMKKRKECDMYLLEKLIRTSPYSQVGMNGEKRKQNNHRDYSF